MEVFLTSMHLLIGLAWFGILELTISKAEFLDEVCELPLEEGQLCIEAQPETQHHFSTSLERCVSFVYKGCGGNMNRFKLENDCIDSCQISWLKNKNKKTEQQNSHQTNEKIMTPDCSLPADKGPCKANIKKWFFNSETGKCEIFFYGGCKGNSNRFDSEALCKAHCLRENNS